MTNKLGSANPDRIPIKKRDWIAVDTQGFRTFDKKIAIKHILWFQFIEHIYNGEPPNEEWTEFYRYDIQLVGARDSEEILIHESTHKYLSSL